MATELPPERLRRTFDPAQITLPATEAPPGDSGIIGQQRAVAALRFGLNMVDGGFNIYAAGPPGIGKMTAVQAFIEELAQRRPTPSDWCYVNDFDDPYQPRALRLPPGRGRRLQQDVHMMIAHLRAELPRAFESDEYAARRDEVLHQLNSRREELLSQISERAARQGFVLQAGPVGIMIIPILNGEPLSDAAFQAMTPEQREELLRRRAMLQDELKQVMKQVRAAERVARQRMEEIDRQVVEYIVGGLIDDLQEQYADLPEVVAFLEAVQKDIQENPDPFRSGGQQQPAGEAQVDLASVPWLKELPFRKYQVNVLIDNSRQQGAPVVVEYNPTYPNLFGRIEKETHFGALYTDFLMIKPGSLHRANGGFLVIEAEDLLRDYFSWDGLKRALRTREIQIEELADRLGLTTVKSLRPQPIPLELKVILVGPPPPYYLLAAYDDEFSTLFKVKADFDISMPLNAENLHGSLHLFRRFCEREGLLSISNDAAARLLEHSLRLAEDQERLSTHFGALTDVVREANYWACQEGCDAILERHVTRALEEKVYRSNMIQARIQELIDRGIILIDTEGAKIGQINGLSVLSLGDYTFGRPSRISVSVGPGRGSILDIEREVKLGGPIHSKGVLILSGYLAERYGQERPLTLSARLVFEQSYEGVEGDSASAAELFALLSALAELPLRQGIAVTGSVNQRGEIQAVGGVNQKIEGFFDVCRLRGLTGEQGVLIPQANVQNLMLRSDVVEAVREGQFHIWTALTIDEGIALLTGVPAGERDANGEYPPESVNGRVMARLRAFAERLREGGKTNENDKRREGEQNAQG
jgi:predicted ATP-dependent protease